MEVKSQALRKIMNKYGYKYETDKTIRLMLDESHTQAIKEVLEIIEEKLPYCDKCDNKQWVIEELKAKLSGEAK